jgi:hypothetical protein
VLRSQFPSATAPTNSLRTDLINVFLKGIQGVNQPACRRKWRDAEMLSSTHQLHPQHKASQNPGSAGTLRSNGRRPGDDVVDCRFRLVWVPCAC